MKSNVSPRLNADLLEQQYDAWKNDPRSVDPSWSAFFEGFELGTAQTKQERAAAAVALSDEGAVDAEVRLRTKLFAMVYGYRAIGHMQAWLNPLDDEAPNAIRALSLEEFDLSESDLDREVATQYFRDGERMTLRELRRNLEEIYCQGIGFEFMHIQDREKRHWLREQIENRFEFKPSDDQIRNVLRWLVESESVETFLGRKFLGEKRFSLEGGESAMVVLNSLHDAAGEFGVDEIEMGMAHRGRLNVLANFLQKPLKTILYEFTPEYMPSVVAGDGDVKYHLGFEGVRPNSKGHDVRLSLAANPSHLEAVNAVVEGKARARQRLIGDAKTRSRVLPVLIHGDAAFAGQGTVAEVLNFSQLPGYRTGGSLHLVINNQIGFTTSPEDARSSQYCTDVAKMIEAPVFHVNGDKPLDVMFVTLLALEFRQKFGCDVVIDMVCYRRQGHNEADQAAITQPKFVAKIQKHATVANLFRKEMLEAGRLTQAEADAIQNDFLQRLEDEFDQMKKLSEQGKINAFSGSTTASPPPPFNFDAVDTGVEIEKLKELGAKLTTVPEGFKLNKTLEKRFIPARRAALESGENIDWAFAESLAWAGLLVEGNGVRISGQDCRRGTFSQRHAVLYDANTRERYTPLSNLEEGQELFCVYNSLLSEAAVLGFDYGYSLGAPQLLIMWEAQFGDFSNGAQVMIDQFISSAESKWQQQSSIVMLLPHGYEGMGPEHSSARLERFLQLCAENNMQVCNVTTPAQYFHLLRRQVRREFRKPLVLMTPKSLLRHPKCVSTLEEMAAGTSFREVLGDTTVKPSAVERVVFCTGKVYYELEAYREEQGITNTAIVRLEQISPFHHELMAEELKAFTKAKRFVWCQEEPKNMGAWMFVRDDLEEVCGERIGYSGREASASPAEGAKVAHKRAQAKLIEEAFTV
ncbi:2-oxoglutarate dehydrogenase E1 component [Sulfuriroseicoccus oceanibius]|uniref:oxoglutarate dehydrogenase (succinyl-transferring) n=1 Tax=Sulfuriroseicoccus oceanibius TaxID=2707525 RepID=A0A6B3L535_9BACT|nr:2-oxoglutarate dehydrogenase E1 component [Sulfuriroseicoccus oceanibius]QQL44370.1 2-oxoglutarate dehydrogenase E1 component [Sulfuriroseicoccus oceanibius]